MTHRSLDPTEQRMVSDILSFLEAATRMVKRFEERPNYDLGALINSREQAWQAARTISELTGRRSM